MTLGTEIYQTSPQNKLVVKDIKEIIKIWPNCSSNKSEYKDTYLLHVESFFYNYIPHNKLNQMHYLSKHLTFYCKLKDLFTKIDIQI